MGRPLSPADDAGALLARGAAREVWTESPPCTRASDEVRRLVATELPDGNPSLDRIAERMRVSERTLRRHLRREGTTSHALLAEVRLSLAHEHLDASLGVTQISTLLGYSTASAFRRAFKRWTGVPPTLAKRVTAARR